MTLLIFLSPTANKGDRRSRGGQRKRLEYGGNLFVSMTTFTTITRLLIPDDHGDRATLCRDVLLVQVQRLSEPLQEVHEDTNV